MDGWRTSGRTRTSTGRGSVGTQLGGGQTRTGLGCPGRVPALRRLQATAMVPAAGSLLILLREAALGRAELGALPGCLL